MRSARCRAILSRGSDAMELWIAIETLDPPSGRGIVDGNDAWTFTGWLELIERVERLKEEPASAERHAESGRAP